jgi:hypothetical protein
MKRYQGFTNINPDFCRDICTLWRNTVVVALTVWIIGMILSFIIVGVFQAILFHVFSIDLITLTEFTKIIYVSAVTTCIFGSIFGIVYAISVYVKGEKHPSVVSEVYRGWKEKYCPTIYWND